MLPHIRINQAQRSRWTSSCLAPRLFQLLIPTACPLWRPRTRFLYLKRLVQSFLTAVFTLTELSSSLTRDCFLHTKYRRWHPQRHHLVWVRPISVNLAILGDPLAAISDFDGSVLSLETFLALFSDQAHNLMTRVGSQRLFYRLSSRYLDFEHSVRASTQQSTAGLLPPERTARATTVIHHLAFRQILIWTYCLWRRRIKHDPTLTFVSDSTTLRDHKLTLSDVNSYVTSIIEVAPQNVNNYTHVVHQILHDELLFTAFTTVSEAARWRTQSLYGDPPLSIAKGYGKTIALLSQRLRSEKFAMTPTVLLTMGQLVAIETMIKNVSATARHLAGMQSAMMAKSGSKPPQASSPVQKAVDV